MISGTCCDYVQAVAMKTNSTYVDLINILVNPEDVGCGMCCLKLNI
jgi:hypothetical protein